MIDSVVFAAFLFVTSVVLNVVSYVMFFRASRLVKNIEARYAEDEEPNDLLQVSVDDKPGTMHFVLTVPEESERAVEQFVREYRQNDPKSCVHDWQMKTETAAECSKCKMCMTNDDA